MLEGLRLLLVDDDEDLRYLLVRRLSRLGAEVRASGDLASLWDQVQDWNPQVAVIDAHLPDGDGRTLGSTLLEKHPELRIILLTGDATALTQDHDHRRTWCLLKPVSLAYLERTILTAAGYRPPAGALVQPFPIAPGISS